jgi:hypothetical protein
MALVLQGGRVVDPGRGLDAALDLGFHARRQVMMRKDLPDTRVRWPDLRGRTITVAACGSVNDYP